LPFSGLDHQHLVFEDARDIRGGLLGRELVALDDFEDWGAESRRILETPDQVLVRSVDQSELVTAAPPPPVNSNSTVGGSTTNSPSLNSTRTFFFFGIGGAPLTFALFRY
jgi:hypothetical protein